MISDAYPERRLGKVGLLSVRAYQGIPAEELRREAELVVYSENLEI